MITSLHNGQWSVHPPPTNNHLPAHATPHREPGMSDLLSSRWAPGASNAYQPPTNSLRRPRSENRIRSTAPPSSVNGGGASNNNTFLPPSEELSRFMKIVARLKWKLPFLGEGYRMATTVAGESVSSDEVSQAEIMFKIDFFEYYALLERAIVHLLAVFNITVNSSRGAQATAPGNANPNANANGYFQRSIGSHRYHANVLQALEEESSPLTPVLGSAPVIDYLRKAKELRNRWKTADMTREERERDPYERDEVLPLASYNFEEILMGIFVGLEQAYSRAKEHVDLCRRPGDTEEGNSSKESDWGFMVDAMDWEAV